jgi:hypothetical protein
MPEKRFSHVYIQIDIVGPLPVSIQGSTHLFTVMDRSTRWLEAFLYGWVSRFGVPAVVTSNRGMQFTSAVWNGLCQKLGIAHKLTHMPMTW